MRAVDAHFHVWRQADLPWLMGPMQPRIFGPYEPIRRDYPMEEYLSDRAGTGVERAVYVQANWPTRTGRRPRPTGSRPSPPEPAGRTGSWPTPT
jgi:predicted TIM-barrel fold metal-dependent hydrolase